PGVPAFLGAGSLRIEPITLPAEAAYPGLQEFVQREERARRVASVAAAEQALAKSRERALAAEQALAETESRAAATPRPRAFAGAEIDVPAFDWKDPLPSPELVTARTAALAARAALAVDEAQRDFVRSELIAIEARIAADNVRIRRGAGDPESMRRAAVRA